MKLILRQMRLKRYSATDKAEKFPPSHVRPQAQEMASCASCKCFDRVEISFAAATRDAGQMMLWVIFDRDEVGSRLHSVCCCSKSGSEIRLLASVSMGLCGLMVSPGA